MKCPRCQQDNPSHAKFCLECGAPCKGTHEGGPSPASYADLQHALTEAFEQQAATREILRVISRSPTDVQPVFDAIADNAARLCEADDAEIYVVDGGLYRRVAHRGPVPIAGPVGEAYPITRGRPSSRAIVDRQTIHVHDQAAEIETEFPDLKAWQQVAGVRTILATPLLRDGAAIGVIGIRRTVVKPFTDRHIALLRTFADQAVIAIENVRLFDELQARNRGLTEALEQQTATSEILRVISSSPVDAQPVFDGIVRSAIQLLHGFSATLRRLVGAELHLGAFSTTGEAGDEALKSLGQLALADDPLFAQVVRDRVPCVASDTETDPRVGSTRREVARARGYRSMLIVPMLHEGGVIGAITVTRREAGAFSDGQIGLLQTFADQAVIAIENVRLFRELEARNAELTELLEQQTATAEILRVISSSPTDLQPVLNAVAERAVRLCEAYDAVIFRPDGDVLRRVAHQGEIPAVSTLPLVRGTAGGRSVMERRTIAVDDILAAADEYPEGSEAARPLGFRSVLSVPLLREGEAIGVISVRRSAVQTVHADRQVELLETFANQAVIAIENVRLFQELETRNRALTETLEQQTATSEILRVISGSTTDAQPVFDTIGGSARRLCEATLSAVLLLEAGQLTIGSVQGADLAGVDSVRRMFPRPAARDTAAGRAVLDQRMVHIEDASVDPDYTYSGRDALGIRSILAVPMLRESVPIGAITVWRPEVRPFTDTRLRFSAPSPIRP